MEHLIAFSQQGTYHMTLKPFLNHICLFVAVDIVFLLGCCFLYILVDTSGFCHYLRDAVLDIIQH